MASFPHTLDLAIEDDLLVYRVIPAKHTRPFAAELGCIPVGSDQMQDWRIYRSIRDEPSR